MSATTDKRLAALVAALGSEDKARAALEAIAPSNVSSLEDKRVAKLVESGMSEDEAIKALAAGDAVAEVEPPSEVLRKAKGFEYAKGRVYSHPALIEAQARVLKTGTPEIVVGRKTQSGDKQRAVLVAVEESGDLSLQNLIKDA